MKGGQVVRRNAPDVRMREVAVMSLSADSGPSTGNTSPIWIVEELRLSTRTRRVAKLCLRPTPPIKIERTCVLNRTGRQGNVYQAHQQGKWNPQSSAYGRFWIDVPSGERKRRTRLPIRRRYFWFARHSGGTPTNVTKSPDVCPRLFRGRVARGLQRAIHTAVRPWDRRAWRGAPGHSKPRMQQR